MEKERAHALEMGKEKAQKAQEEDAEKGRRALEPTFSTFFHTFL
jgi:hypothetical protein